MALKAESHLGRMSEKSQAVVSSRNTWFLCPNKLIATESPQLLHLEIQIWGLKTTAFFTDLSCLETTEEQKPSPGRWSSNALNLEAHARAECKPL